MYQSKLLVPTMRETPDGAEALSHRLMLRSGLIRQVAAGVYTYLPLGRKVLLKLEGIIREEMETAGAQELLMPAMQPAELWEQSGRYSQYGPELMRLQDRHGREFALGPTHEEVITALAAGEINSYRQLPATLFQIQTKFRDERRPRFGLLRGREFLMKDAYSFSLDEEGLDKSYQAMFDAYHRIFTKLELRYRAVHADGGNIGGAGGTHEFMALANIGEDTIACCDSCGYAANVEKAEYAHSDFSQADAASIIKKETDYSKLFTPSVRTIGELTAFLRTSADQIVKTLIYIADGSPIAVLVRGDHEANEVKLKAALGLETLEMADHEQTVRATGAAVGFAGPVGLGVPIYADYAVAQMREAIVGANELDYHLAGVRPGRDWTPAAIGDYRNAEAGDGCPQCESGVLALERGIEMGHVFKLGTKYSDSMRALAMDRDGRQKPLQMGCYGIGVSRLLSAVMEQHGTDDGMLWPRELAPFQAHIIPVSMKDEAQRVLTEELRTALRAKGVAVLLDDRDERPGVKFKDADLIGIPHRIIVGRQAAEGIVEWKRGREESVAIDAYKVLESIG